jgi:hypothetical protein
LGGVVEEFESDESNEEELMRFRGVWSSNVHESIL